MKRPIFCPNYLSSLISSLIDTLVVTNVKRAIFILSLVIIGLSAYGQTAVELKSKLIEMKGSEDTLISKEATKIESLVYNVQPTLYIQQGVEKTYGETPPVRVTVDAQSVNNLKDANQLFSQVELITIKIDNPDDLNLSLDLTALPGFTNLKYIHFLCSINCAPGDIAKLYTLNPGVTVFYIFSLPS
jgi:hypothetical protein